MKDFRRSPLTAGRAGRVAASISGSFSERAAAGSEPSPAPGLRRHWVAISAAGLGLDDLLELHLSTLECEDAVVGQRRVAVLVDRVRPEHALAVLGVEQRLQHVLLLAGLRTLDRVDREAHG